MSNRSNNSQQSGFSLVEVILAIGVFALTIVAVIGLLGPIAQQVRDLQDTKVANSLPAPIREELNRIGFEYFVDVKSDGTALKGVFPTVLFGTMDGSRVIGYTALDGTVITRDGNSPPGIPEDERYFLIELTAATGNLNYNDGDAHVAFQVDISWPYRLPDGSTVQPEDRKNFEYFTAIVVGEPF
ncbi:type IV pilus modification PilV family protein [Puniceicoccus vermicola]|uniref:Type II secretion system protein n=1 Tax=Puniceicoccus vermicola TaxID=388746 RepID=A0A7X1B225_9BACT|nr:type II secretion system protein [Puniceicoccus vermicola]MBC2604186.1 type II secretion system protein [Puniceicoccus vermicola]